MIVNFLHPSTSDIFQADLDAQCRGRDAIDGLVQAGFVERNNRGSYDLLLARTQTPILPEQTFGAVGVMHGDNVAMHRRGQGAGS